MTARKPIVLTSGQLEQIQTGDYLLLPAASTANSSVNAPHGTAPTSPVDGDIWTTTSGLYARINGVTVGPFGTGVTAASTTEVLTGTDTSKAATPDAIAALWEQGSDVASAATVSLGEGGYFNITGTTTITDIDFATDKAGRRAWVKFAGILTLTYNASTLILPTAANITTAAGDTAEFVSEGSDVVRCVAYTRASGAALSGGSGVGSPALDLIATASPAGSSSVSFTSISGAYADLILVVRGASTNGATFVNCNVTLNNDTGTNYHDESMSYNNATFNGGGQINQNAFPAGWFPGTGGVASDREVIEVTVYNYTDTNGFKSIQAKNHLRKGSAAADQYEKMTGGSWDSNVAVTRIDAILSAGNFATGTLASLYGRRG